MRHLASLPDAVQAENFGDYLIAQGIPNSREEAGGKWAIWVQREDQIDQARAELERFQREPGADRYQNASRSARAFESAQEQLTRRLAKNFVNVRLQQAQGELGVQQTYPATIILIAICVLVAILSQVGRDLSPIDGFFFVPLNTPLGHGFGIAMIPYFGFRIWLHFILPELAAILHGQVWRLVTPIFIHFGAPHLIFNMWWFWDLGRMIERRKGTIFFSILVLVSAVLGNIGQFAWAGPGFGGMSGVVYALFGYAWMKGHLQPEQRIGVQPQAVWIMIAWLVVCMTGMLAQYLGDVANAAHFVGLLVGVTFGVIPWAFLRLRREYRSRAFR